MSELKEIYELEIHRNAERSKLAFMSVKGEVGGYRIAGPKAWGGSTKLEEIEIRQGDLVEFVLSYAPQALAEILRRNQLPEAVVDKIDAERYRHLRELMQFSTPPNKPTTMELRAAIPAPEHNPHRDWIGEQFDASVDRSVDASLRACLTAEEIPAFEAARQYIQKDGGGNG